MRSQDAQPVLIDARHTRMDTGDFVSSSHDNLCKRFNYLIDFFYQEGRMLQDLLRQRVRLFYNAFACSIYSADKNFFPVRASDI